MRLLSSLFLICLLFFSCNSKTISPTPRHENDFNFNWKFFKTKDQLAISDISDKNNWQSVKIPHDWAIKTPYNQAYQITDSTPNLSYIGWYKKEFTLPKDLKGKNIRIDFDGVYNNAEVYLNGTKITERPYGFSPFSAYISDEINIGEKNTLVVKVDRTAFLDGRWYNGAGIYRDVKLVITEPIHIKKWGIGITTPKISKTNSTIKIKTEIVNGLQKENLSIKYQIKDTSNKILKEQISKASKGLTTTSLNIENPNLWSIKTPYLYTLTTTVIDDKGKIWDKKNETFGIRSLKYTANDGFYLNGEKTYFKGVCLHHDAGGIGVAVPDDVWRRRLNILKEGGVNAIRTSHNTPSKRFLNLCDELGFLVQAETFDEMDYPKDKRRNYNSKGKDPLTEGYSNHFQKWGERDLKDMLLRDRNHPSVVMWSIGNEIEWTYPRYGKSSGYWNSDKKYYYDEPPISIAEMKENMKNNPRLKYELAKTAQKLSKWVKEIDTTRPVTANLVIPTVSHFSGYTDALDIVGYSYRASVYDYGHRNYPEKMILGTENWANWVEWKSVLDNPHIPGIFLWTGIFYMGETSDVNERGSDSGLIDFAGFKTPRWHMFKTLWNNAPEIYATTIKLENSEYVNKNGEAIEKTKDLWKKRRWGFQPFNTHWNYNKNENIVVEVYTNSPTAELFINDKSYGVKKLNSNEDHIIKWIVPFEKGTLKVVGEDNSLVYEIKTAETPSMLELKSDRTEFKANAYDVAHIEVQLTDKHGIPVKHLNQEISFEIEGPANLLSIDNGNNVQRKKFDTKSCITDKGKLLLIIQATKEKGNVSIKAISNNCKTKTISLKAN
ncbi:glycoside hydrolase family 2 TIM barrel-domain containing protein [Lutibacter citreus]|uniref:glycoside hydrolase family 2 TIM barrel-domain containing protein n=1 Tax=Lutibacter citreus TaxID=2138210 RepID=UPI000DBEA1D0|nr:glycoside hydrolase family 2 TIM barrel-domain containing protein [Lutibacter citreus]